MSDAQSFQDEFTAVREFLGKRGYTFYQRLGDGHTRRVYEVEYLQGPLRSRRVAKIPRRELESESVTTQINLSKGDPDAREIRILNDIYHPNIVQVYDAFPWGDRTLTIEEFVQGNTLEDLIRLSGSLTKGEKVKALFTPIIEGMSYLHERGIVHGDIKPSNILVGHNQVKISDLQNAQHIDMAHASFLPTRGGTPFAHPQLLNAPITHHAATSGIHTDFYSFGATLYYALTGELPFDYTLTSSPNGTVVQLGEKELRVALNVNGTQKIEGITKLEHNARLAKALRKVPREYKKVLSKTLAYESAYASQPYTAREQLQKDFEAAVTAPLPRMVRAVRAAAKYAGIATITGGVLAGVIIGGTESRLAEEQARKSEPNLGKLLESNLFTIQPGPLVGVANEQALRALKETFRELRDYDTAALDARVQEYTTLHDKPYFSNPVYATGIGKRLSYSLLRSLALYAPKRPENVFSSKRSKITLVPDAYIERLNTARMMDHNVPFFLDTPVQEVGFAIRYLRECLGSRVTPEEVFMCYFTDTPAEIFAAQQITGTPSYLLSVSEQGVVHEGYRTRIHSVKAQLVDAAVALYTLTEEDGARFHNELIGYDGSIDLKRLKEIPLSQKKTE